MSRIRFIDKILEMTSPRRDPDLSGAAVVKEGVRFYVRYFLFAFVFIVAVMLVSRWTGLEIKHALSTSGYRDAAGANLTRKYLRLCLWGPILEELTFRLWNSFKRRDVAITVFVIAYVLLTRYILPHDHDVSLWGVHSDYFEHFPLKVLLSGLLAAGVYFLENNRLSRLDDKTKHVIICVSLLVFTLLHVTNAICAWYLYPVVVLMCLPQLILGTTATYYRIQLGFWAGVAFHCLVNLFFTLLTFLH